MSDATGVSSNPLPPLLSVLTLTSLITPRWISPTLIMATWMSSRTLTSTPSFTKTEKALTISTLTHSVLLMVMRLARNDHRAASRVPFSIFGVFEHPHGVSADHTTSASGVFSFYAKRVRLPMIRKTKFRLSQKFSLLHILLSTCVIWKRFIRSCFLFLFML